MRLHRLPILLAALAPFAVASRANAQTQTAEPLEVGQIAPDFSIPGGTRFGVLRDPITLSDFRGKTVVLAFFFRARTRG